MFVDARRSVLLDAEGVSPFNKRIVETAMRSTGISPCEVEGAVQSRSATNSLCQAIQK